MSYTFTHRANADYDGIVATGKAARPGEELHFRLKDADGAVHYQGVATDIDDAAVAYNYAVDSYNVTVLETRVGCGPWIEVKL